MFGSDIENLVVGLWWLTPYSTVFQSYRGGNFIGCKISIDKNVDNVLFWHIHVTKHGKQAKIAFQVF
jgi:hypothetical protein